MANSNYTRTISVRATPEAAYAALTTGFAHWWTVPDKTIQRVGDQAKFMFPPGKSYWTLEAVRLKPGAHVETVCVDAHHLHDGLPPEVEKEWLDTRINWSIEGKDGYTDITVEHEGLVPSLNCYEVCEAGWDFFFVSSLKAYLDTGVGTPHHASS